MNPATMATRDDLQYIGPYGLDGQFDFVLYNGVSFSTFAYGDRGMIHADYWMRCSLQRFPSGSIMTPYWEVTTPHGS